MPYKNPTKRKRYVRDWKRRKQAGVATRTTPVRTPEQRVERTRIQKRAWAKANPNKVKANRDRQNARSVDDKRDHNLRKRYGITLVQWNALIEAQRGLCPVCNEPLDMNRTRAIHTEHDHTTKVIRGITHAPCNTALGRLGDDVAGLTRALVYVSGASAPETLIDEHW